MRACSEMVVMCAARFADQGTKRRNAIRSATGIDSPRRAHEASDTVSTAGHGSRGGST